METINLTQGQVAIVDDTDFEELNKFKWHAAKRGRTYYAMTNIRRPNGKWVHIYMHRQILPSMKQIDHEDRNGLNNQRLNLRSFTTSQNQANSRKRLRTSSKYKGVYWHKRYLKWQASIKINQQRIYLGRFNLERDAARAYNIAATRYFGIFANLNVGI